MGSLLLDYSGSEDEPHPIPGNQRPAAAIGNGGGNANTVWGGNIGKFSHFFY
ncbi:hypothetical protein AGMMS49942_26240 [Spirochaetia bacterium]|nr:hypothetical protein AGMMS49942_26240 [Spirochaetia bacterium]